MALLLLPPAVKYVLGFGVGFVLLVVGLYWFANSGGETNGMIGGLGAFVFGGILLLWGELNRRRAAFG